MEVTMVGKLERCGGTLLAMRFASGARTARAVQLCAATGASSPQRLKDIPHHALGLTKASTAQGDFFTQRDLHSETACGAVRLNNSRYGSVAERSRRGLPKKQRLVEEPARKGLKRAGDDLFQGSCRTQQIAPGASSDSKNCRTNQKPIVHVSAGGFFEPM
jgi:hypothetical protein